MFTIGLSARNLEKSFAEVISYEIKRITEGTYKDKIRLEVNYADKQCSHNLVDLDSVIEIYNNENGETCFVSGDSFDEDEYPEECFCDNIVLTASQAQWIAEMFCALRKDWYALRFDLECEEAPNDEETYGCTLSNIVQMLGCELEPRTRMPKKD